MLGSFKAVYINFFQNKNKTKPLLVLQDIMCIIWSAAENIFIMLLSVLNNKNPFFKEPVDLMKCKVNLRLDSNKVSASNAIVDHFLIRKNMRLLTQI